jgi:hypothetical protein
MLKEIATARRDGERQRRWFVDDYFDLTVWLDDQGGIWGFQLCYDCERTERALTWTPDAGYSHSRVDSGEAGPTKNQAPILVPDDQFAAEEVLGRFCARGALVDAGIRKFIDEVLAGWPGEAES